MSNHIKIISVLLSVIMIISVFNVVPLSASAADTNSTVTGATSDEATKDEVKSGETGWDGCTWALKGTVLTISGNGRMANYGWWESAPWGTDITEVIINSGVNNIGESSFYGCKKLTRVTIPDSVISIGDSAFESCTSLRAISIPDSVISIGKDAFEYCTSLRNIGVPDSVTDIGYDAFYDTAWYNSQPKGLVYAGKVAYEMKGNCPENLTLKEGTLGIAGRAFAWETNLKNVVISDSVTNIGYSAFDNCQKLTNVTIGKSVTRIAEHAFLDCINLERVDISDIAAWCNISFEYVTSNPLNYAHNLFLDGELVTELIIPDSVTSIDRYTFAGCTSLTGVKIGNSVTTVGGGAFSGCTGLTIVRIPESVKCIGDGNADVFRDCDNLTDVYYDGSEAGWKKIEFYGVYWGRANIHYGRSTTFEESYDYEVQKDGTAMITAYYGSDVMLNIPEALDGYPISAIKSLSFWFNEKAERVVLSSSIKTIGAYAFAHSNIKEVTIPNGVEQIGFAAFWDNPMQEITIPASVTFIGEIAIGYSGDKGSYPIDGFTIYGYSGTEAERYANENGFTFIALDDKPEPKVGDADGDGEVSSVDVTLIQRYCAFFDVYVEESVLMQADVDKNGRLEIIDATYIQRHLAGMEIPYTIG